MHSSPARISNSASLADFAWDKFDAYLFDIDGTLLRDPDRTHYNAFIHALSTVIGVPASLDGVQVHGSTDPAIVLDTFRKYSVDPAQWPVLLPQTLSLMASTVAANRDHLRPILMPAVIPVLDRLQSLNRALGVGTGNLESIGWIKLENCGLRQYFSFGGFSDDYAIRSEMIAAGAIRAREAAGASARICVVGDTPADIHAARANDLPVIAVATGMSSFDDLASHHPDLCLHTLQDLLDDQA